MKTSSSNQEEGGLRDYKSLKEGFVSGNQGCSLTEVVLISLIGLQTHLLWRLTNNIQTIHLIRNSNRGRGRFRSSASDPKKLSNNESFTSNLVLEVLALIIPLVGINSFLSERLVLTNLILIGLIALLWAYLSSFECLDETLDRGFSDLTVQGQIDQSNKDDERRRFLIDRSRDCSLDLQLLENRNFDDNSSALSSLKDPPYDNDQFQSIDKKSLPSSTTRRRIREGPEENSKKSCHSKKQIESIDDDDYGDKKIDLLSRLRFKKSFITIYRTQLMVMTSIAILAVDFEVFPRRFSKTESWGISLMDLGVGSFVFSLGLISTIPILKMKPKAVRTREKSQWSKESLVDRNDDDDDEISSKILKDLLDSSKKVFPLVLIGLVRLIFVKGVEYPEHVTEYGIHWNFFFTLAILNLVGALIKKFLLSFGDKSNLVLIGFLIGFIYQYFLSLRGLQDYVLSDSPRDDLISANREGLSSIPGYIIIYLFGFSTGLYTLAPFPDYYSKLMNGKLKSKFLKSSSSLKSGDNKKIDDDPGVLEGLERRDKLIIVNFSWIFVWWSTYFICDRFVSRPSRRLANLTYCLFISSINVTLIGFHVLIEELDKVYLSPKVKFFKDERRRWSDRSPIIFESINNNSLSFFLISNLLTGLINLSFETMFMDRWFSILILSVYVTSLIVFSLVFRKRKMKLFL